VSVNWQSGKGRERLIDGMAFRDVVSRRDRKDLGGNVNLGVAPPEAPVNPRCLTVTHWRGLSRTFDSIGNDARYHVKSTGSRIIFWEKKEKRFGEGREIKTTWDSGMKIIRSRHGDGKAAINENGMETGGNTNTHGFINVNPTDLVVSHERRKDKIGSRGGDLVIVVNLGFLATRLGTKVRPSIDITLGSEKASKRVGVHSEYGNLKSGSADCEQMK
jgi:hypothetical protein